MTTDQLQTLQGLRKEGMSIRGIAEEMGITKSAVEKALKDSDGPEQPAERTLSGGEARTLEHEREMKKMDNERKALELKERELAIREKEVEAKARQTISPRAADDRRDDKVEAKKSLLLTQYKRLTKEFFDNCQDSTWDTDEVDDYVSRLEDLQERIEKFCDAEAIDHEELAVWVNLGTLVEGVTEQKEEQAGGFFSKAEVDFDLSDDVVAEMEEQYKVEDFEDEHVELDEDDLDEEDDEDDEDEQDEDSDEEGDEDDEEEAMPDDNLEAERRRWL